MDGQTTDGQKKAKQYAPPISFEIGGITISLHQNKMNFNSECGHHWLLSKPGLVFVCVEVLRPSQPNGVMSSVVSLPNHTFTGQA